MSIQDFFKGKSIFITGGSGFIGKVLIEKILRSCDGIENIYILLRKQKNLTPDERLSKILENELFDKLKKTNPAALKKLIPIHGDVKERKLGMSKEDEQTIIERVNIIYHGAASVRFDDFLKDAILLNTRGTREIADLALQIKNLEALIHISTTYCNTDKEVVEERIYPPHADWKSSIQIAEKFEKHTLDVLAPKYIEPLPNTYTFAKSLSEHVVNDLCKGKLPAVIFRPSVVLSTLKDPFEGWTDNFNGPLGLLTAGGKGILKVCYGNRESKQDYIPVDIVVRLLIIATHERALNKDLNEVMVYNSAAGDNIQFTNSYLVDLGAKLTWDAPCSKLFWYPSFMMTKNWYVFYVMFLLYHMIPALIGDAVLKLTGQKTILTKIQRKVYIANMALIYFMQRTWKFVNNKAIALTYKLMDCDKDKFSINYSLSLNEEDLYTFYIKGKIGAMKHLFKEEFNFDLAYRNTMIMWILDRLLHLTICGIGCWYLIIKANISGLICNKFKDVLLYWNNL